MRRIEFGNDIEDYLRLAKLGELNAQYERETPTPEAMQEFNLKNTSNLPPEPLPTHDINNFDVRANPILNAGFPNYASEQLPQNKIEPPLNEQGPAAQDAGFWSKFASNIHQATGLRNGALRSEIPAPKNLQEKAPISEAPVMQPPMPEMAPEPVAENAPISAPVAQAPQAPAPELGNVQTGSVSQIETNPTLKQEMTRFLGEVTPEQMKIAEGYEKAMNAYANSLDDVTAGLTDQEKAIRSRIESRQLSNQDKILMAVALLAPVLIGGLIGGKEGALGALGGGIGGLAENLNQNIKGNEENQQKLSEIALSKANVMKEKAGTLMQTQKFRKEIADNIPNKDLRDIFLKHGALVKSPDGKEQLIIETGNPLLPIKSSAIRDKEDYENMKKELPKHAASIATLDKAELIMDSLHSLIDLSEMESQNKNIFQQIVKNAAPFNLYDYATGALKAHLPFTRDTIKDENGDEVKISSLISTYRAQLADAWRDIHAGNKNAFKATEQHFEKQLSDPTSWNAFITGNSSPAQFRKQLDIVKNNFEEIINYLDHQGYDISNLKNRYVNTKRNAKLTKTKSDKERAEAAAADAISKQKGK